MDPVARRLRREKWLLSFILPAIVVAVLIGGWQFLKTGDARWLLLLAALLLLKGK